MAHDQFRKMRINQFKEYMNEKPVLIDVRRIINREEAEINGINYKGL